MAADGAKKLEVIFQNINDYQGFSIDHARMLSIVLIQTLSINTPILRDAILGKLFEKYDLDFVQICRDRQIRPAQIPQPLSHLVDSKGIFCRPFLELLPKIATVLELKDEDERDSSLVFKTYPTKVLTTQYSPLIWDIKEKSEVQRTSKPTTLKQAITFKMGKEALKP